LLVDVGRKEKKVTEDLLERRERRVSPDLEDNQEQQSTKPGPKVSADDQELKEKPEEPANEDCLAIKDKRETQESDRSKDKREYPDKSVLWESKEERVIEVLQDELVHQVQTVLEVSRALRAPKGPWENQ